MYDKGRTTGGRRCIIVCCRVHIYISCESILPEKMHSAMLGRWTLSYFYSESAFSHAHVPYRCHAWHFMASLLCICVRNASYTSTPRRVRRTHSVFHRINIWIHVCDVEWYFSDSLPMSLHGHSPWIYTILCVSRQHIGRLREIDADR